MNHTVPVSDLSTTLTDLDDLGEPTPRRRRLGQFFRTPQGAGGSALLLIMVGIAVIGPLLAPHGINEIVGPPISEASREFPLGTDTLGRDIVSRVLNGGASVILLPLAAVATSMVVATIVGLATGYLGGRVDALLSRVVDTSLAVPSYLLVLVVVAAFGNSTLVVVLTVAIIYAPYIIRVIRAATQTIAPKEFVLAARARGERLPWILFREVLPNIGPTLLVEIALRLTYAVMFIASLSFLGLGVRPPSANWGVLVAENRLLLLINPVGVLVPALLIALLAISINLLADALTEFYGDRLHARMAAER